MKLLILYYLCFRGRTTHTIVSETVKPQEGEKSHGCRGQDSVEPRVRRARRAGVLEIAEAFWVCPGGSKKLVELEEAGGEGETCPCLSFFVMAALLLGGSQLSLCVLLELI